MITLSEFHSLLRETAGLVIYVIVPDEETGLPGVWGEWGQRGGGQWGQARSSRKGIDKLSVPNKGRDNMGKDEKDQSSRTWWRRIRANRVSSLWIKINFVSMASKFFILIIVLSFKRINHMVLKNHFHWTSVYPPLYITSRTVIYPF
jgi:hypothetical protein